MADDFDEMMSQYGGPSTRQRSSEPSSAATLLALIGLARRRQEAARAGEAPYSTGPEQEPLPPPSFSSRLSNHIDLPLGAIKAYAGQLMQNAGLPPLAQTAGHVAMGVASSPLDAISSASKLAMAPFDWATGREVMASPVDVLSALPLAGAGAFRAGKTALEARDFARQQRAFETYMDSMRKNAPGSMTPSDIRIKDIINMIGRSKE